MSAKNYSDIAAPGYVRVVEGGRVRFEREPETYERQPETTWRSDLKAAGVFLVIVVLEVIAVFAYHGIPLDAAIKSLLHT